MAENILYIVAGPIGNLEDVTFRAVRILKEVSFIMCEDTRQSKKLLDHYEITGKKLFSFHSHTKDNSLSFFIEKIKSDGSAAYLTDCGTPGISDPGSKLASEARKYGIKVIPLPGASALTTIASVAGFAGKEIYFGGFLSKKPGRRINELNSLKRISATIVIYESPHRIIKTITALAEVFPDNQILIGREISKIHEEFISGTAGSILNGKITEKGEFAIAIDNNNPKFSEDDDEI
ncbi:MAG TPA: 16S rRNA (cytidine(1402)-2'-O)-methyltransferase [Spirochaetota bacterium]|nr:16S rRNA (cytidine(1402)-2'-O)-methyltransferase [Spirochaetota bacterium]HPJ14146.1 16S rRNA (cytidine(1402)-2'-O)-methyltransferase [Spirochaetota bacterium]